MMQLHCSSQKFIADDINHRRDVPDSVSLFVMILILIRLEHDFRAAAAVESPWDAHLTIVSQSPVSLVRDALVHFTATSTW
jgi:hypothetical protein